jgi:fluoride exporter
MPRFDLTFLYLAVFAIIGAFLRYGQSLLVQNLMGRAFPFGTLSINVIGSFLMGFLFFATLDRINISPELRTGILTGGLGTYTTFSTFSLEAFGLIENGEMVKAGLYVGGSVVLSIAAVIFGAYLSRSLGAFALK